MKNTEIPVSTPELLLVLCTCPDENVAVQLAQTLVKKRLAACVNINSAIQSVYRWQGEIRQDKEVLLMIKTTTNGWEKLEQTLLELHPYDVPEIIAMPICAGSKDYLDWVGENICTD
ncbi:divalent-cation tolerance protein CutA [Thiolapillus sp.]